MNNTNFNTTQEPLLKSIPLGWFPKGSSEQVACMFEQRGPRQCLGLYVYILQPDGRWVPNYKGLCMEVDTWQRNLPAIMQTAQNIINTTRP